MTVYELMSMNKTLFSSMIDNKVDLCQVNNIELYNDYVRLTKEGHKKEYIVNYLGEVYGKSSRTVFRIIKAMRKQIKL
jgi:hypothetical protein